MENLFYSSIHNKIISHTPEHPKKITGTRLSAVLGKNPYCTPFEVWAAMSRLYERPYEETKYTAAGKVAEPKQIEWLRSIYPKQIITPTDKYGADYMSKTYGDFFPNNEIFGGMWDSLVIDGSGHTETVIECKTHYDGAKSWMNGIPLYYQMQAALYAYLCNTDQIIFLETTLKEKDYANPESIEINRDNTQIIGVRLSQMFPDWDEMIQEAKSFWKIKVMGGVSPDYDPERDKEIMAGIRENNMVIDA